MTKIFRSQDVEVEGIKMIIMDRNNYGDRSDRFWGALTLCGGFTIGGS